MNSHRWILLIIFFAGLIILLLPDASKPVIEFNKIHGPSIPDLIGLSFIMISWVSSCITIIQRWPKIKLKLGNKTVYMLLIIYLLSCFGIVLSLRLSLDELLWFCVAAALIINVLFIIYAFITEN